MHRCSAIQILVAIVLEKRLSLTIRLCALIRFPLLKCSAPRLALKYPAASKWSRFFSYRFCETCGSVAETQICKSEELHFVRLLDVIMLGEAMKRSFQRCWLLNIWAIDDEWWLVSFVLFEEWGLLPFSTETCNMILTVFSMDRKQQHRVLCVLR